MNMPKEFDDETALFLREMREEEAARRGMPAESICETAFLQSGETRFDSASLHKMVRHRNEMVQLLREFLALHPEDTPLTRRARRFTGQKRPGLEIPG